MIRAHPSMSPWYARSPALSLAVTVALTLATLTVLLAYDHAAPASSGTPGTSAAAPSTGQRDPSVPDIPFVPNTADAQEPSSPTF